MKFGVATFITDQGVRPGPLGAALEERGFSSLVITEHSHIPASRETPYPAGGELPTIYYRTLDPFIALTAAASTTQTLRLATGIALVPQRDVIHTAKEVASLDLVSDGRVVFGVGVGWNREEMRNHGTDPAIRGEKMDEQLAALKEIWTKDQAEFHGKHVNFDPIFAWPKPVQSPHPPIYIGGNSQAALNRLLRVGDGWMPLGNPSLEEIKRVRGWLADNGRADVPVLIFGFSRGEDELAAYAEAGIDEYTFLLPTQPESETLADLDGLAKLVESVG
ncbi:MAG TPA: LLM class F420-dependent oxidoreductase [Pseudonocardia sp.]|jgi:probable F420-dependent oxidoreductase|nr:LLM class F420-dependent oxidoreductase [Pseudonocardia sp.]